MVKRKEGRKERKKKDENAPKRGSNAYLYFVQDKIKQTKSEFPTLIHKEVIAKLGEVWKTMSQQDKNPYEEKAKAEKERYAKEKSDYDAKNQAANNNIPGATKKIKKDFQIPKQSYQDILPQQQPQIQQPIQQPSMQQHPGLGMPLFPPSYPYPYPSQSTSPPSYPSYYSQYLPNVHKFGNF